MAGRIALLPREDVAEGSSEAVEDERREAEKQTKGQRVFPKFLQEKLRSLCPFSRTQKQHDNPNHGERETNPVENPPQTASEPAALFRILCHGFFPHPLSTTPSAQSVAAPNSSGSLATFTAMRRASSKVSTPALYTSSSRFAGPARLRC